jgi:hypothetical protein
MSTTKKELDKMFMLALSLAGGSLFVLSAVGFSNMAKECTDPILYDCMTLIMVIGACLLTTSITYAICNSRFGDCYQYKPPTNAKFYFVVGIGLSIITAALGVVSIVQISKTPLCTQDVAGNDTSKGKTLKYVAGFTIGISFMALIGSVFGLVYLNRA